MIHIWGKGDNGDHSWFFWKLSSILLQARAQLHSLDRAEGLSLRPSNGPDAAACRQPLLATQGGRAAQLLRALRLPNSTRQALLHIP